MTCATVTGTHQPMQSVQLQLISSLQLQRYTYFITYTACSYFIDNGYISFHPSLTGQLSSTLCLQNFADWSPHCRLIWADCLKFESSKGTQIVFLFSVSILYMVPLGFRHPTCPWGLKCLLLKHDPQAEKEDCLKKV